MNDTATKPLDAREQEIVTAILPSLGYFGYTPETALVVPVDAVIDRLCVRIEAPDLEILNIGAIRFFDETGKELDKASLCASIEMSTAHETHAGKDIFQQFCDGHMLHSNREATPHVWVYFTSPIKISKVEINNRRDIYGSRSRWLTVLASCDDKPVTAFRNLSMPQIRDTIARVLSIAYPSGVVPDATPVEEIRDHFRAVLVGQIESDQVVFDTHDLAQMLPLYQAQPQIDSFHLTICTQIVLARWKGRNVVDTKFLGNFSNILSTDHRIIWLNEEIERVIACRTGTRPKVVIGRHHIHESRLIARKDQYLDFVDIVIKALAGHGITAMLGYGTLLGAVREGGFLAHDDDVDLISIGQAQSQAEAEAEKSRIIQALKEVGVTVRQTSFWHLHASWNGLVIDIFPAWQEDDLVYLPMEKLNIRSVPASIMLPDCRIELYERKFPAPADPAAFLEQRYGASWKTPDPFYEWPWPIQRH